MANHLMNPQNTTQFHHTLWHESHQVAKDFRLQPKTYDATSLFWIQKEVDHTLSAISSSLRFLEENGLYQQLEAITNKIDGVCNVLLVAGIDTVQVLCTQIKETLKAYSRKKAPWNASTVRLISEAIQIARSYLEALTFGQPDRPLELLPIFNQLTQARGNKAIPLYSYFEPNLDLPRQIKTKLTINPIAPEEREQLTAKTLEEFGQAVNQWLYAEENSIDFFLSACHKAQQLSLRQEDLNLWIVSYAFFEAMQQKRIATNIHNRQISKQIADIFSNHTPHNTFVRQDLMKGLLYQLGQIKAPSGVAYDVSRAYQLSFICPPEKTAPRYSQPHSLKSTQQILTNTMNAWGNYCSGVTSNLISFEKAVDLLVVKLSHYDMNIIRQLAISILAYARHLLSKGNTVKLKQVAGLEIAKALLLIEQSLNNIDDLEPTFFEDAENSINQIQSIILNRKLPSGQQPTPESNNRYFERHLLKYVSDGMLTNLKSIEQTLDAFFRKKINAQDLRPLKKLMHQMHGPLVVLDQKEALKILEESQRLLELLLKNQASHTQAYFKRISLLLSSLAFFAEHLRDANMASSNAFGVNGFSCLKLEEDNEYLDQVLSSKKQYPVQQTKTFSSPEKAATSIEPELLAVFSEESKEILKTIHGIVLKLQSRQSISRDALTLLRRAFHTLKGSSRLIQLNDYSKLAEVMENTFTKILDKPIPAAQTIAITKEAHRVFFNWQKHPEKKMGNEAKELIRTCQNMFLNPMLLMGSNNLIDINPSLIKVPIKKSHQPAVARKKEDPRIAIQGQNLLEIEQTLFHLYLEEARHHVAKIEELISQTKIPSKDLVRAAHTLASASAAVGIIPIQTLAYELETSLVMFRQARVMPTELQLTTWIRTGGTLTRMLSALIQKNMPREEPMLISALQKLTPQSISKLDKMMHEDLHHDLDLKLVPLFLEEADDTLQTISTLFLAWKKQPNQPEHLSHELVRELHTLKGSARMVGALNLGSQIHQLETKILALTGKADHVTTEEVASLEGLTDYISEAIGQLRLHVTSQSASRSSVSDQVSEQWPSLVTAKHLRVPLNKIIELIDQSGEIDITRSAAENELMKLTSTMTELHQNVLRMRTQLKEIEIEADAQVQSRQLKSPAQQPHFDPLELDRFGRLQEVSRMLAEGINDVSTIDASLRQNLSSISEILHRQSKLNQSLSSALLDLRATQFGSIAHRLRRVVRAISQQQKKLVQLNIKGAQTLIDQDLLEQITPALEHLLRNAVGHGIEKPARRKKIGKKDEGLIELSILKKEDNITISIKDDGAGLNFKKIRNIALEEKKLKQDKLNNKSALQQLIFEPNFSTDPVISEDSGRGIGLDIVKKQVISLSGHIEIDSIPMKGTMIQLHLPISLAILPSLLVRACGQLFAVPAHAVQHIVELKPLHIEKLAKKKSIKWLKRQYQYVHLNTLLGYTSPDQNRKAGWLILIQNGHQRLALEIEKVEGKKDIVVKDIGQVTTKATGISGASIMPDGSLCLIIQPASLMDFLPYHPVPSTHDTKPNSTAEPTVLIVDDSITVRKVTSRLLSRQNLKSVTAKDGSDAILKMQDMTPQLVLCDIEMPRMDGFELLKHMRNDSRLMHVPVVIISSRTADRHRMTALGLGANHYLGKPYDDEELIRLVQESLSPA